MSYSHWDEVVDAIHARGLKPSALVLKIQAEDHQKNQPKRVTKWYDKLIYQWYRFKHWLKVMKNTNTYVRFWQRITRGWDDSETWSLDHEFANWFLPRLKRFKELTDGFPSGLEGEDHNNCSDEYIERQMKLWYSIIDKMIWSLEFYVWDYAQYCDEDAWKRYEEGMTLLVKYLHGLWW